MSHPVMLDNVFRADVLQPGLTAEEALSARRPSRTAASGSRASWMRSDCVLQLHQCG